MTPGSTPLEAEEPPLDPGVGSTPIEGVSVGGLTPGSRGESGLSDGCSSPDRPGMTDGF